MSATATEQRPLPVAGRRWCPIRAVILAAGLAAIVSGCSSGFSRGNGSFFPGFGGGVAARSADDGEWGRARHARRPDGARLRVGKPYVIAGKLYTPRFEPNYNAVGIASWYGGQFQGRLTANGEVFDTYQISAAHPTLPLNQVVRVTNLENGRTLTVRINDRGPFKPGRIIDLSRAAARALGMEQAGLARVRVQALQMADRR